MFGHLGFSYVGLIFLVLLIVPNILWSRNPPEDYDNSFEHGILMLLERIGQVGCFLCALMFSDFNFAPFTPVSYTHLGPISKSPTGCPPSLTRT